jgi:hypothetical protein
MPDTVIDVPPRAAQPDPQDTIPAPPWFEVLPMPTIPRGSAQPSFEYHPWLPRQVP